MIAMMTSGGARGGAPSGSRKSFFECSISSVNCYEFRGSCYFITLNRV
jgi:hypothetical protein